MLMTVREVARELGYTPEQVRRMAREQKIPMKKLYEKGDWRISRESLEEWIRSRGLVHG